MKMSFLLVIVFVVACGKSDNRPKESVEMIIAAEKQHAIFETLMTVTHDGIPESVLNDSLAFLVLPVHASCPACRNKTIDSILKYHDKLLTGHYIIIAANGGRKTISRFFRERGGELPFVKNKLFLDSTKQSYSLYEKNPAIYYVHNKKAYKKVGTTPVTIKRDLQEFFSGYRNRKLSK